MHTIKIYKKGRIDSFSVFEAIPFPNAILRNKFPNLLAMVTAESFLYNAICILDVSKYTCLN